MKMPVLLLVAVTVVSTALAPVAASGQPRAALRVVVIEGEDAVNVIQQKTATAPIVEVRDRNDLPVPGAVVTFAIKGNAASFVGGARTISVATNAAGRASASALTPLSRGAVQIQVNAAFQGQTASAVISQTNVATAAQAASNSGQSVAKSAGGGAKTAVVLGAVGAVAAGGAVAARKYLLGEEIVNCSLKGSQTSFQVGSTAGTREFRLVASPPGCYTQNLVPTTTSNFFSINGYLIAEDGIDTALLSINVQSNPPGSGPRSATITWHDIVITITQDAVASAPACDVGGGTQDGQSMFTRTYEVGRESGLLGFVWQTNSGQVQFIVSNQSRTIHDTGCIGREGNGAREFAFTGGSAVTVRVIPNCGGGTGGSWLFRIACAR